MRRIVCALACSTLVFAAGSASAQEKGKVGLTMGYPQSVGIVWHVTDRIALRPEVSISHSWSETTERRVVIIPGPGVPGFPLPGSPTETVSTSAWSLTTGLTGLIYLWKDNNVSAYLAPAVTYSRASIKSETSPPPRDPFPFPDFDLDITTSNIGARGALGVQYAPHRRFSVFGELGVDYDRSLDGGVPLESFFETDRKSGSWGTRSAAGIIFYF